MGVDENPSFSILPDQLPQNYQNLPARPF